MPDAPEALRQFTGERPASVKCLQIICIFLLLNYQNETHCLIVNHFNLDLLCL